VTTIKRTTTLVLIGAALAAAGCGSEDEGEPIPSVQAEALLAQLEVVQNRLDQGSAGACQDVFTHAESPNQSTVDELLAQIPEDVDPEVRSALEQSFARLWELVGQECDERAAEEEQQQPEPEPTETAPPPEEEEEEPDEEEEEAPPEEEEPPPPDETPLPPEGDGDNDGAIPGEGNGGGVGPGAAAG
jgi:hypothetical protein